MSRKRRGGAIRRTLALAGTTAIFAAAMSASALAAEPWGYEQVSPVEKGAGAVSAIDTFTAAPDGESIIHSSIGGFEELPPPSVPVYARYLAQRGPNGWVNRSVDVPYDVKTGGTGTSAVFAIQTNIISSANLRYSIVASARALTPGAIQGGGNLFMQDNRTGELQLILASESNLPTARALTHQGQTGYFWVAGDGKSALFGLADELPDVPVSEGLVQWTSEGGLENVGRYPTNEAGEQPLGLFTPPNGDTGTREPMPIEDAITNLYLNANNKPVYLRRNGESEPISVSEREEDEGTVYNGELWSYTDGGEYAFFSTKATRLTDDTPAISGGQSQVLYRYELSSGALEYIGQGKIDVVQSAQDGQTVAFASTAALDGHGSEGSGIKNLYVWRNGTLHYVMTSDPKSTVGSSFTARVVTTLSENGRYFYFTDNSPSLAEEFGSEIVSLACAEAKAPTVPLACDQAYVFDADAAEDGLACVSCTPGVAKGRAGDPATENSGYTRFDKHQSRNVANDGTTFFTTIEALDPVNDTNELPDVYAYKDGEHRLVSTAKSGHISRFIDASVDGKTIFFSTTDAIVPQDTDRVLDLYMTREGAGFPYTPPVVTPPCLGIEACHAGIAAVPAAPGASSATFRGNPNPPVITGAVKVKKAAVRGVRATLTVRVSGRGRLVVKGKGVKRASKPVPRAKTYRVTVALAGKAKRRVKHGGKVKRKLRVTFTPEEGRAATASRVLTFRAGSGGKRGR